MERADWLSLSQGWYTPVLPAFPAEERVVPVRGGAAAGTGGSGGYFAQSRPGAALGAPAAAGGYSARQDGWLGVRPPAAAWRLAGGAVGRWPRLFRPWEGHGCFLNMKEKCN